MMYLLTGSTGEYSDTTIWNVAIYENKEKAENDACTLNAICEECELWKAKNNPTYREAKDWLKAKARNIDPDIYMDYTGTSYSVDEVVTR